MITKGRKILVNLKYFAGVHAYTTHMNGKFGMVSIGLDFSHWDVPISRVENSNCAESSNRKLCPYPSVTVKESILALKKTPAGAAHHVRRPEHQTVPISLSPNFTMFIGGINLPFPLTRLFSSPGSNSSELLKGVLMCVDLIKPHEGKIFFQWHGIDISIYLTQYIITSYATVISICKYIYIYMCVCVYLYRLYLS